jgi:hypothetical protein
MTDELSRIFKAGPSAESHLQACAILDGYAEMPTGDELLEFAEKWGVSRRTAFRIRDRLQTRLLSSNPDTSDASRADSEIAADTELSDAGEHVESCQLGTADDNLARSDVLIGRVSTSDRANLALNNARCLVCGRTLTGKRRDAQFCGRNHREQYARRDKKRGKS